MNNMQSAAVALAMVAGELVGDLVVSGLLDETAVEETHCTCGACDPAVDLTQEAKSLPWREAVAVAASLAESGTSRRGWFLIRRAISLGILAGEIYGFYRTAAGHKLISWAEDTSAQASDWADLGSEVGL